MSNCWRETFWKTENISRAKKISPFQGPGSSGVGSDWAALIRSSKRVTSMGAKTFDFCGRYFFWSFVNPAFWGKCYENFVKDSLLMLAVFDTDPVTKVKLLEDEPSLNAGRGEVEVFVYHVLFGWRWCVFMCFFKRACWPGGCSTPNDIKGRCSKLCRTRSVRGFPCSNDALFLGFPAAFPHENAKSTAQRLLFECRRSRRTGCDDHGRPITSCWSCGRRLGRLGVES